MTRHRVKPGHDKFGRVLRAEGCVRANPPSNIGATKMLKPRRERFAVEYVRDCNATQAAIRAGYSVKIAHSYGPFLAQQREVAARIEALMAAERRRVQVNGDRVVLELMRVAFSDIRTYLTRGEDGAVALRPLDTLNEHETAAIAFLSPGSRNRGASIRLHRKTHALRALARHLGLDDRRHFVDPRIDLEETARIRAELEAVADAAEQKALLAPPGDAPCA
jgi:phage terminase small subunit